MFVCEETGGVGPVCVTDRASGPGPDRGLAPYTSPTRAHARATTGHPSADTVYSRAVYSLVSTRFLGLVLYGPPGTDRDRDL